MATSDGDFSRRPSGEAIARAAAVVAQQGRERGDDTTIGLVIEQDTIVESARHSIETLQVEDACKRRLVARWHRGEATSEQLTSPAWNRDVLGC